jgi:hypothetical protein
MGGCEGDVITIYRDPEYDEEGNRVKYGIQMNVCEVHKGDEPGWKVEYGPDSDSEDGIA